IFVGLGWRYHAEDGPTLYRSNDGGVTWRAVDGTGTSEVDALATHGRSVWVVTRAPDVDDALLYRSEDGGERWSRLELPSQVGYVTGIHRVDASVAYLTTMNDDTLPVFWR